MFGRSKKPLDPAQQALEDIVNPPKTEGLTDPGDPIILVAKVYYDGRTQVLYHGAPAWAVETLRSMADQIEAEHAE